MEPWDGPAAIAFTDGRVIGATLDRNGLRPGRYVVTHDDLVVMASEAGVLDIAPEQVKSKGRLQPGKMFLVDTVEGRIVSDKEIKQKLSSRQPYAQWVKENQITMDQLPEPSRMHFPDAETVAPPAASLRIQRRRSANDPAPMARRARSRLARWAPTRLWRASPTNRSRCSTISSSSSRRSPILLSIPSAKRW
jgi:hypothetical protein